MKPLPGILIVDDQAHMLRLLEFNLRPLRARLHLANSAGRALEIGREEAAGIRLVIVDYELPDLNGLDFVDQFRQLPNLEGLPVIMLTAQGQAAIRNRAESMGINAFITKPFSPGGLRVLIQSLIEPQQNVKKQ
jgi:CheY-like chemotaxis protein